MHYLKYYKHFRGKTEKEYDRLNPLQTSTVVIAQLVRFLQSFNVFISIIFGATLQHQNKTWFKFNEGSY